ncbi:MAG: sigma-70 family RNA polymerase sigma factor, partial [Gallionella sp.]|nr:sigma-70 family RNA polymerase sigma factor [Gallionella sp.]
RRRRLELLHDPDQVTLTDTADSTTRNSPQDRAISAEFESVVAACLESLPPAHRQVVDLVDMQGLSYAEAAAALGVPVGTVMSRLHRARVRIRRHLTTAGLAPKRSMR